MREGLYRTIVLCLIILVLAALTAVPARGGILRKTEKPPEILQKATTVFEKFTAGGKDGIPTVLLQKCSGIAIFISVKKIGLGLGVRGGQGLMVARGEGGSWSAPAFFTLRGIDTGIQAGVESMNVVLLIMKKELVDDFLRRKLELGADASVAAGPTGENVDGNVLSDTRNILSYTEVERGLFVGVAVKGVSIKFDDDTTQEYYGREYPAEDILIRQTVAPPESAAALVDLLKKHCLPAPEPAKAETPVEKK